MQTVQLTTNLVSMALSYERLVLKQRKLAEQEFLESKHGQLISNFKQLRLQHSLSLEDLSRLSYISKNALVRAEQGTYANPMPALLTYWLRRLPNLSELELLDGYEDFQLNQRARHPNYFGPTLLAVDPTESLHPFRQLRRQHISPVDKLLLPVGVDEVSRALCLPIDTLRYWEKKWRLQQSVPKLVQEVLSQIGYPRSEIRELSSRYRVWRESNNVVKVAS